MEAETEKQQDCRKIQHTSGNWWYGPIFLKKTELKSLIPNLENCLQAALILVTKTDSAALTKIVALET